MSIKNQVAHTLIETAKATAEAMGNHGHRLNALEAQLSHLTRPNPSLDLGKLADQPKEVNGEVEELKAKLRKAEHELWTTKSALVEVRNLKRLPVGEDTPNVE
tara:strand:- start:473 stop:781 length:309 start_codon:yes stop_codon:yes gene_type:complete